MPKKILVIDDNPDILKILQQWLSVAGFDVILAPGAEAGLNLLEKDPPDLIILDMMMPVVSGFTVYELLKTQDPYKKIPVIILSSRQKDIQEGFENDLKPDAFISKPFDHRVLISKIEELTAS